MKRFLIQNLILTFTVNPRNESFSSTLELIYLNLANELEVKSIIGSNGLEKFDLFLPLNSYDLQRTSEWFDNLLKLSKSTLSFLTQEYLSKIGDNANDYSALPIITKRNFDLKSVPFQCILLTEALIWSNNMKRMLETNKNEEIKYVFNYLNKSITECSNLQTAKCEKRLKELLSKLVLYYLYQREVTLRLMKLSELNSYSYEWQVSLKYEFDLSTRFRRASSKDSGKCASEYKKALKIKCLYLKIKGMLK